MLLFEQDLEVIGVCQVQYKGIPDRGAAHASMEVWNSTTLHRGGKTRRARNIFGVTR